MSALRNETVLSVHHWTDELFSFRTTRDKGFRFASGQFTMIGLKLEGKPVLRVCDTPDGEGNGIAIGLEGRLVGRGGAVERAGKVGMDRGHGNLSQV